MTLTHDDLRTLASEAPTREDLWVNVITRADVRRVAEIGVYRGLFAEQLLDGSPEITDYYMIDPWRHLDDWNKPANKDNDTFNEFFDEAMRRTEAHSARRRVLRGRTSEVVDQIPDEHLDLVYIDGDHTLRGITIDLIQAWDKVRPNGWIGGDDFAKTIWQHNQSFEPTLVFPFAVYFAEAMGCPIHALPYQQFIIVKNPERGFSFTDLTGRYPATDLLTQFGKARGRRGQAQKA
ncbi:MAG: class I SAM-dependent methyltransferase [Nocardioides sp.]